MALTLLLIAAAAPGRAEDAACAAMAAKRPPRPTLPMTIDAHHAFRDAEFAMMDQGGKGYLDGDDFLVRMRCETGKADPAQLPSIFRSICGVEGDRCDAAQFRRQGDAEFARVDADHDGQITAAELAVAGGTMHKTDTAPADPAEALVGRYVEAHNRHDLDAEMGFYAEDATFTLSQGRGTIQGRPAIRDLLRFDEVAGSFASPRPLTVRREGAESVVSSGPGFEHSRVFQALGIEKMYLAPTEAAFRIRDGRIAAIRQSEFTPACGALAADAIRRFGAWTKQERQDSYARLYKDDKLAIRADLVEVWIAAIEDWRRTTGWKPAEADLQACGR